MSFVSLRESGYSCSSIALLNRVVKVGVRKGLRSLMSSFCFVGGFSQSAVAFSICFARLSYASLV